MTGYCICFVAGHLKYDQYVCAPGAAHLRRPVNAYGSGICGKLGILPL